MNILRGFFNKKHQQTKKDRILNRINKAYLVSRLRMNLRQKCSGKKLGMQGKLWEIARLEIMDRSVKAKWNRKVKALITFLSLDID